MKTTLLLAVLGGMFLSSFAVSDDREVRDASALWSTWSGAGHFELRGDFLPDYGLEIIHDGRSVNTRARFDVEILNLGSLELFVPYGNFEDFDGGRLDLRTDIVLRTGDRTVSLEQLVAIPQVHRGFPSLRLMDGQGRHLLTLSNPHVQAQAADQLLTIKNADLIATDTLSELLGLPKLADVPLGMAALRLNLHVPPGADNSGISPPRAGLSCTGRPFWPQDDPSYLVDVALIDIGVVAYQGRQPGTNRIKVAPSAQLQNVNFGDAVWIPKFSQEAFYIFPPRDQHPFLVWNMYRIADGRIQQLATSGVKHAFFSLNNNCTINCGSGRVLWPGCTDTYTSGTNDSNFNQGPRGDIVPSEGLFFSQGSFFDPGGTGSQTNNSGNFENRLMIEESELTRADADYFLDSWYVVMHDIDIWNSMGYHGVSPTGSVGSGSWGFGPLSPFTAEPVIQEWVPETSVDPLESHSVITVASETPGAPYPGNQPQGHLRVLGKATEIAAGRWRYNYAVQNYDFDRNVDEIRIPLPQEGAVFDTFFYSPAVDGVQGDEWTVQRNGDELVFTAPASNPLTWYSLFNFEVETDIAPIPQNGLMTLRAAETGTPAELSAEVVAPGFTEDLFADGFEPLP